MPHRPAKLQRWLVALTVASAPVLLMMIWRRLKKLQSLALQHVRHATVADEAALQKLTGCHAHGSLERRLRSMSSCQHILVLPDTDGGVKAAASLLIEHKCARGGRAAGHMSALFPPPGNNVLVTELLRIARQNECYKVIMNAPPALVPLLSNLKFVRKELTMVAPLGNIGADAATVCCLPRAPIVLAAAGYTLRPLEVADGAAAYIHLLSQLSCAPPISEEVFRRQLARQWDTGSKHVVYVVDGPCAPRPTPSTAEGLAPVEADEARFPLLGCATIVLEEDVLNAGGEGSGSRPVALIEDVVVDKRARGTGLGRALLRAALDIAAAAGCVSAVLNCSEANAPFYKKCGFAEAAGGEVCYSVYLDA